MGSPEYPDDRNEFNPPSTIAMPMHGIDEHTDSDENEALNDNTWNVQDPYAGYEPLNVEDLPDDDNNDDCDAPKNDEVETTNSQKPTADAEIAFQVWNAPRPTELDIVIDSTKSEEIKTAMSKIKLGAIQTPDWAKNIPETKWIDELLQEVRRNKSPENSSSNPTCTTDRINPGTSQNQ